MSDAMRIFMESSSLLAYAHRTPLRRPAMRGARVAGRLPRERPTHKVPAVEPRYLRQAGEIQADSPSKTSNLLEDRPLGVEQSANGAAVMRDASSASAADVRLPQMRRQSHRELGPRRDEPQPRSPRIPA